MNQRHEASREAFEVAYKDCEWILLRNSDSEYMYPEPRTAWRVWCRAIDYATEPQRKQIKPGPDKPVTEPDLYCGACGQPSAHSLWFSGSHTAMCPLCAAEFVCNAGHVDTTQ